MTDATFRTVEIFPYSSCLEKTQLFKNLRLCHDFFEFTFKTLPIAGITIGLRLNSLHRPVYRYTNDVW